MLLLWLSIVCMIPFDLKRLDSNLRQGDGSLKVRIMDRIMAIGKVRTILIILIEVLANGCLFLPHAFKIKMKAYFVRNVHMLVYTLIRTI